MLFFRLRLRATIEHTLPAVVFSDTRSVLYWSSVMYTDMASLLLFMAPATQTSPPRRHAAAGTAQPLEKRVKGGRRSRPGDSSSVEQARWAAKSPIRGSHRIPVFA